MDLTQCPLYKPFLKYYSGPKIILNSSKKSLEKRLTIYRDKMFYHTGVFIAPYLNITQHERDRERFKREECVPGSIFIYCVYIDIYICISVEYMREHGTTKRPDTKTLTVYIYKSRVNQY